ncbi:MAG: glutaredoxin family protein [Meiothermus sp.]|nr:glutaredoxin family protein [Meiothermus sp.]
MAYALVSRKGCHLCEEAEALLRASGLEYNWQDVDADEDLRKQFTFRVPVLLLDGKVVLEGKFTPERLEKKLKVDR